MRSRNIALLLAGALVLCACTGAPVVTGDARGPFDTAKGLYGGNEFDARAPEGQVRVAGESSPAAKAATSAAASAAPASAATSSATPIAVPVPVPAAEGAPAPIAIDANAFAAVFGRSAAPLHPSADQLMQLDSLSLVAAEAARIDLQKKILACRRAGERCLLAHD